MVSVFSLKFSCIIFRIFSQKRKTLVPLQNKPINKKKILLVLPDGRIHKLKLWFGHSVSFREAPLTLTTLAALIPEDVPAHVEAADESVQSIPFHKEFDLVAISCLTGTSTRAYEIAKHFAAKGSVIVLGGIHVTLRPEEAKEHAHAIVSGCAEEQWPKLLRDFRDGKLKKHYHGHPVPLNNYPIPKTSLLKKGAYMNPHVLFATRGCKSKCDFCSVPAAGLKWDTRPVEEVVEQIKHMGGKRIVFNDVSLLEDREYALSLFRAIIPLRITWGGLCTSTIAADDEMLDLMARSGCIFLLIGLESVNQKSLQGMHKGFNKPDEYRILAHMLHEKKIILMGCFIFGSDHDTLDVFRDTVEMVDELKIDVPRYAIYTPFPGTEAFRRLEAENRILHTRWEHYDTQHVVFQPKNMTPQQLDEGFRWAYKQSYSIRSVWHRTKAIPSRFPFSFMGNLAYRIYLKRLDNENQRIFL